MTTYTGKSFNIFNTTAYESQTTVIVADDALGFEYSVSSISSLVGGQFANVDLQFDGDIFIFDGSAIFSNELDVQTDNFAINTATWGENDEYETQFLMYGDAVTGSFVRSDFLVLGGDNIETIDDIVLFYETLTYSPIETGPFSPGMQIDFDDILAFTGRTENDEYDGTSGADIVDLGIGNDTIDGSLGNDTLTGGAGDDSIDGGSGIDTATFAVNRSDATVLLENGVFSISSAELGKDILENVEAITFTNESFSAASTEELYQAINPNVVYDTARYSDAISGYDANDNLTGSLGNDTIVGNGGNDSIYGDDGADVLNGGDGDDSIYGGSSRLDIRDVIYAGAGNDNVDGGYGNDLIYGMDGDDIIAGGFGSDELQGQNGNDVITGSALSDEVFGGAGNDFVNGGFGHDRINGGTGADKFYHLGISDHGSDWVQDFTNAEGDVLLFGNANASASDFQINYNHTANAAGERSGDDNVQEAFVIYKPTGQIIWALVDGAGESSIQIDIGGTVTDLVV